MHACECIAISGHFRCVNMLTRCNQMGYFAEFLSELQMIADCESENILSSDIAQCVERSYPAVCSNLEEMSL